MKYLREEQNEMSNGKINRIVSIVVLNQCHTRRSKEQLAVYNRDKEQERIELN